VLNDQLYKTSKDIISIYDDIDDLDDEFDTSTGHDHDGTDSKKVIATNLLATGLSDRDVLYNNNGTFAGSDPSELIYIWIGNINGTAGEYGRYEGTSLTPTLDAATLPINYEFMASGAATTRNILPGRFLKTAKKNTITIHALLWSASADANKEAILTVNVGGQSNTVKSVTSTTPTWVTTAEIDVSSLTDGTVYDITISLHNETANSAACCAGIILIAN
jgi:hypothetical protein